MSTTTDSRHLRQFIVLAFALLLPSFVLWAAISAPLAQPAIGLCNIILSNWLPGVVQTVYVQGAEAMVVTLLGELNGQILPAAEADNQLAFTVDSRLLSYSLPFYAALHFATPRQAYLADFLWGSMVLYALLVFGLVSLCLKELMLALGDVFLTQPAMLLPGPNGIAILYQLNSLLIPALAPALLWVWQNRETPMLATLLDTGRRTEPG